MHRQPARRPARPGWPREHGEAWEAADSSSQGRDKRCRSIIVHRPLPLPLPRPAAHAHGRAPRAFARSGNVRQARSRSPSRPTKRAYAWPLMIYGTPQVVIVPGAAHDPCMHQIRSSAPSGSRNGRQAAKPLRNAADVFVRSQQVARTVSRRQRRSTRWRGGWTLAFVSGGDAAPRPFICMAAWLHGCRGALFVPPAVVNRGASRSIALSSAVRSAQQRSAAGSCSWAGWAGWRMDHGQWQVGP